jgi:hypothetical protein
MALVRGHIDSPRYERLAILRHFHGEGRNRIQPRREAFNKPGSDVLDDDDRH